MSKVMRTHTGITEWNGDFWCDSCGKLVRGITTVNGMDFCAKCYQETFGETEKDKQIADLEAKLAEKDKEIEELKAQRRIYLNRSVEECNKITDLEFELQHKDQDKISFAIAELEKVKVLIHNAVNIDSPEYDLVGLYDAVSNQIKQLKEMK